MINLYTRVLLVTASIYSLDECFTYQRIGTHLFRIGIKYMKKKQTTHTEDGGNQRKPLNQPCIRVFHPERGMVDLFLAVMVTCTLATVPPTAIVCGSV